MTGVILNHDPLVPQESGGRYLHIIPTDYFGKTDHMQAVRVWWPRVGWAGGPLGSVPPEPAEEKLAVHVFIYKEWFDHNAFPTSKGRLMSAHFLQWMDGPITTMWTRAADARRADSHPHLPGSQASCPATVLESPDSQEIEEGPMDNCPIAADSQEFEEGPMEDSPVAADSQEIE